MIKVNFPFYNKVQRKPSKGRPSVVTYHSLLKHLEGILHRNKYLINMNVNQLPLAQSFPTKILISF